MTDIDANYIARTHGIDALRRTIDLNTSTQATSDGEQYGGTTDESSAGVLTDLAPVGHEAIGIHPAAEEKKSFLDGNAPTRAESDSGRLVMAPSSQRAEINANNTNSGQQEGDQQKNQQDQQQKTKNGHGIPPPPIPPSVQWPDVDKFGNPKRTYRNARAAMEALAIVCSYDEFHDRMFVAGHSVGEWAGELSDALGYVLRQAIIDNFNFDPGKDNVNDATTELCLESPFNPLLDYLNGLRWDGIPRLGSWLAKYLGAEDTPLNRAIGQRTLIAAVRRARKPGCKFDYILTLEGSEGTMKSMAISVLAGPGNFSDQTILSQSDKEQQELVSGIWLFELADLAGMRRADVEKVKAFATRTHDRARPAYGRRRIDAPRRCIFIATTNDDEYLKSQTGNRRFWPAKTGTIDIDSLRRDRDQLWAEAAKLEAEGASLTLPSDLLDDVRAAQDERREHDPWDDLLANLHGPIYPNDDGDEEERIATDELLKVHLAIPPERMHNTHTTRLKRTMRRLGWLGPKKLWMGTAQKRGYFRKVSQEGG
jgi:Virulence-associated protein E